MRKLTVSAIAFLSIVTCAGCSTTAGNIGLGLGLGAAGTISALYCALTC